MGARTAFFVLSFFLKYNVFPLYVCNASVITKHDFHFLFITLLPHHSDFLLLCLHYYTHSWTHIWIRTTIFTLQTFLLFGALPLWYTLNNLWPNDWNNFHLSTCYINTVGPRWIKNDTIYAFEKHAVEELLA